MYKIILDKTVIKFLDKHRGQAIILSFEKALNELKKDPYSEKLDIKPMQSTNNNYRLRLWDYRFLYEVKEKEIMIVFFDAGSRWDIYKKY